MKGKGTKITILITILLLLFIQLVPTSVVAVRKWVDVDIDFIDDVAPPEDVEPGAANKVFYYGIVSVKMNPMGPAFPVKIELIAYTDQGWNCTVTPNTFSIPPGTGQPFTIEVTVPAKTSYYTGGTMSLYGKASSFPDYVTRQGSPITGTIKIEQYQNYTVKCDAPVLQARPGSIETFEISVTNTGNARDRVYLKIENRDELRKHGILASLDRHFIDLESHINETVTIRVRVSKGAKAVGDHEIVVKTYSMRGPGEVILIKNQTLRLEIPQDTIIYTDEFFISSLILIVIIFCIFFTWQMRRLRKKRKIKLEKS